MMAVAEGSVGDLDAHHLGELRVSIAAGKRIAKRGKKDEAAEVGRNSREGFPP
jgi:hypothetical protein